MLTGLFGNFSQRRGRYGTTNDASQRNDRQHVRNHLDELRRDQLRTLQLDLERLRGCEEQACKTDAQRIPSPENRRGKGNETAPGRHLVGELVLIENQTNSSETGEDPRKKHRAVAHAL